MRTAPVSAVDEFRQAIRSEGFRGQDTACIPPLSVCDVRTLQLPNDSEKQTRQEIGDRLTEIHGVPASNVHFDFWHNPTSRNLLETNVLCIADRWTEQILFDHRRARLTCQVLDGLPQSLARAAALSPHYVAGEPIAVLDWGFSMATFCLVTGGQPVFIRGLPQNGFHSVEEKIQHTLGCSVAETRRAIQRFGVPLNDRHGDDEVQQTIAEIVSGPLNELAQELARTLTFLDSQKSKRAARGLIFGAGALLKNIEHWLGNKLGLALRVWGIDELEVPSGQHCPLPLLGPAIASSSLIWEKT
jgi:Tfp pilus assembly PilM family ATPase